MKIKLATAVAFCALFSVAVSHATDPLSGGKVVRTIRWTEVPLPKGATLSKATGKDGATLVVAHAEAKPVIFPLLKLENPGIDTKAHALRCAVRYSDVEGVGYLETWNVFPAGEPGKADLRAFSRTMGSAGPLGSVSGASDWRPAVLPFDATGAKTHLKQIELNLFLPGKGQVEIKDVELVEFADAKAMWDSVQGVTAAMLAPPATPPSAVAPARPWKGGLSTAVTLGGFMVVAILAIGLLLKKRRDGERRRMKAMDAM